MNSQHPDASSIDWRVLVTLVRNHLAQGDLQLRGIFANGVRLLLKRSLGQNHLDARVEEVFAVLKDLIRTDYRFEPDAMVSVLRSIVKEHIEQYSCHAANRCRDGLERPGGSDAVSHREHVSTIVAIVKERSPVEQKAFARFYLDRLSEEQICEELSIDRSEFQLMRAEIKAAFEYAIGNTSTIKTHSRRRDTVA